MRLYEYWEVFEDKFTRVENNQAGMPLILRIFVYNCRHLNDRLHFEIVLHITCCRLKKFILISNCIAIVGIGRYSKYKV